MNIKTVLSLDPKDLIKVGTSFYEIRRKKSYKFIQRDIFSIRYVAYMHNIHGQYKYSQQRSLLMSK